MSANFSLQTYRLKMVKESELPYLSAVVCPDDIARILQTFLDGQDREVFVVVALDAQNQPIGIHTVSIGSVSASIVHPREVFKFAFLANASYVILAHNHPSGNPTPSQDDIELTRRMCEAGKLLGVSVLDHLVFGDVFLSMKERGLMN